MKRSVLVAALAAVSLVSFGVGTVLGGVTPPPPPGWPGGHLFGVSPPNQFPPMGTSTRIPLMGRMEWDLDGCEAPFGADLVGFLDVSLPNAIDNSGPTTIDVEIVQLSLTSVAPIGVQCGTDESVFVSVGAFGNRAPPAPSGQLVDQTNQPNGAFPAGLFLPLDPEFTVTGLPGPIHGQDFLQFFQPTAGWPPIGIQTMTNPGDLPVPLEDTSDNPAGSLIGAVVLPVTPAEAFMKSEAIRHESETAQSVESVQQGVSDLSDELGMVGQSIEEDLEAQAERMLQEQERAQGADSEEAKRLRKVLALLRKLKKLN